MTAITVNIVLVIAPYHILSTDLWTGIAGRPLAAPDLAAFIPQPKNAIMQDAEQLEFVHRISSLLYKCIRGQISGPEIFDLCIWAHANEANRELFEELVDLRSLYESLDWRLEVAQDGSLRRQGP